MANQGFNVETLAGLQYFDLSKIIKSLQGIDSSIHTTTPAQVPPAPEPQGQAQEDTPIPAATARVDKEAILWEKVGSSQAPSGDAPPPH